MAVEEIKFGDNDTLASLLVPVIEAELLILVSDIDGLYTANPKIDKNATLAVELLEEGKGGLCVVQQDIEMPVTHILTDMEMTGAKVDVDVLKKMDHDFDEDIRHLEEEIHTLDAHLAQDFYTVLTDGIEQAFFQVQAVNTEASRLEEIRATIKKVIDELLEKGLNKKQLEASLNQMEFAARISAYHR